MYDELVKRLREATGWKNASVHYSLMNEAADAIEELLAERDEVNADSWKTAFEVERDEHRWIPATERLPEGEALAFNALKGSYGYREYLLGYIGEDRESDTGFCCESEGEILVNVTHWMPLPEPPKEE